jgi:lipopolysaccharide O-acetyltransferase
LNRLRRFLQENGLHVFGMNVAAFSAGLGRNFLISRKLGVAKIKIGPRAYLRGLSSVRMGEDFAAEEGLWLEAITSYDGQNFTPKIIIGQHVRVSRFVHIAATHFVEIGDNVLIGSRVVITDHNHGQYSGEEHTPPNIAPSERPLDRGRRTVIARNVWLCEGVVVTPGSSIGEGSVIGANSVVAGNIPAFSIASGAPATVRKRFDFDTRKWCNIE